MRVIVAHVDLTMLDRTVSNRTRYTVSVTNDKMNAHTYESGMRDDMPSALRRAANALLEISELGGEVSDTSPPHYCGGDRCSGLWNLPCDNPEHRRRFAPQAAPEAT